MKKSNVFYMDSGIFPVKITVYVNQSAEPDLEDIEEQLHRFTPSKMEYIRKNVMEYINWNCANTIIMKDNTEANVVYFHKVPESIEDLGIVAHEFHHLTDNVLRHIGMKKRTKSNMEVFAYLHEYFLRQFYEKIRLSYTTKPQQSE